MAKSAVKFVSSEKGERTKSSNLLTKAQMHMRDHVDFITGFDEIFQMENPSKIVPFAEDFIVRYPLATNLLIKVYQNLSKLGLYKLCNEIALVYLTTSKRLLEIGQQQFGLPPIFRLRSVSRDITDSVSSFELVDQAAVISLMYKLGVLNQKPVLPITHLSQLSFVSAFIPYLEECFEVIEEENHCMVFRQNIPFASLDSLFYQISDDQYGHNNAFFYDVYLNLTQKHINPYSFQLKEITTEKAMNFLENFGLELGQDFIVVQLPDSQASTLVNYFSVIEYILEKGFKVFRIGGENTLPLFKQDGFIDLTQVQKPAEVDIFLCGSAKFYFGPAHGLYRVSHNFGVPCCIPSAIDYGGVRPNNFVQYLKIESLVDKSTLSLSDIHDLGLDSLLSAEVIEKNFIPQIPSSEQMIEFIKEMFEYLEKGEIFQLNVVAESKKFKYKIFGGLCSQSLSLLPQTVN